MPYIPKRHEKYNLLPYCKEHGGEVFSYPSDLLRKVESLLPEDECLIPYGYKSYDEYYEQIDKCRYEYAADNLELEMLLLQLKLEIQKMNIKEDWAVLRFVGNSTPEIFGLTHGKCYYWPCSKERPGYEGVIDNEEFTSYIYPTRPELWKILEDPLGITSALQCTKMIKETQGLYNFAKSLEKDKDL